jgi:hypothetical protein
MGLGRTFLDVDLTPYQISALSRGNSSATLPGTYTAAIVDKGDAVGTATFAPGESKKVFLLYPRINVWNRPTVFTEKGAVKCRAECASDPAIDVRSISETFTTWSSSGTVP